MSIARSVLIASVLLAACGGTASTPADAPLADPPLANAQRPADAPLTNAHRIAIADSILSTLSAFSEAVADLNAEQVASFYSKSPDEMRWIEDGEVLYRSREDVAAAVREANTFMATASISYQGAEIMPVAPGVAVLVAGFAQQFTTHEGETGGFAGAITAVMVHEGDRWLFLSGHTSSAGYRAE